MDTEKSIDEFVLDAIAENKIQGADYMLVIATNRDYHLAGDVNNTDNVLDIAYGLYLALRDYIETGTHLDATQIIDAFHEVYNDDEA